MMLLIDLLKDKIKKFFNNEEETPWKDYYGNIPKHLEYPRYSIYELIEQTVSKYPKYIAYEYFGRQVNYKKFYIKIENAAKALKSLGVKEGDRITICMPNTPEAIIMFYAVNMVGAVSNMIHPLSSEKEIEFYLNKAKSRFVLALDLTYNKVLAASKNTKVEKIIIASINDDMKTIMSVLYYVTKGYKVKININVDNTITWDKFIASGTKFEGIYKTSRGADDEAVILYSGGTSGNPKGIILTNLNFNALAIQSHLMCDPSKAGDSLLVIMPIFHGFGLGVCIHAPLHAGMKCILIPQFKAKEFAKLIKKYKPAFLVGVPTMYEALVNNKPIKKKYLSSVTTVISGGDILNPVLRKRINEYLAKHGSDAQVRVGYGLTESTAASCLTPRFYYKEGSIGIPFPDTEYKIVKIDTISEAKVSHDGEICINGPTVMKEYLDEKEETANTLKKHADGKIWLHTGDVGYIDYKGIVFFKSRLKRIIVSSGYNIYPHYIEKVLNMHPAIETCIVVGIEHPYKVQVPKAYIVLKSGFTLDEKLKKEIRSYCEKFIAKYSLPYEYEYRDTLPKTLVGKIAFNKLEQK